MTEPRVIAEFNDYNGMINAFRARFGALGIAVGVAGEQNHAVAGLPLGYIQKLIGPEPPKRIGMTSLGALAGTGGVRFLMVEDDDATRKYVQRLTKRDPAFVHSDAKHVVVTRRKLRELGAKGGLARAKNMKPACRRRAAKRAALIRWSKVKEAVKREPEPPVVRCRPPTP